MIDFYKCKCGEELDLKGSPHECPGSPVERIAALESEVAGLKKTVDLLCAAKTADVAAVIQRFMDRFGADMPQSPNESRSEQTHPCFRENPTHGVSMGDDGLVVWSADEGVWPYDDETAYCTVCHKDHAANKGEQMCGGPGTWFRKG